MAGDICDTWVRKAIKEKDNAPVRVHKRASETKQESLHGVLSFLLLSGVKECAAHESPTGPARNMSLHKCHKIGEPAPHIFHIL